jgi:RNA polymerase sigma factor (sigma-70 family)
LDAVRRQRVVAFEPITDSVPSHTYADGTDVVEFVSKQQELALLRDAIASLPPRCREVLTLRTARGCSQKEIARRMGISENAVEKQMANGLRLCSAYFAQRGMP